MKNLDIEKATKRYNSIMTDNGYEHNTIGTGLSEGTENWNLRDMVAEADYVLSTFYESGHSNAELKDEDPKEWRSMVGRLQRFINAYEPFIDGLICDEGHCSKYDN